MSEQNETVFLDGFIFKRPREGAPDFVKGAMAIKVDEAIEFLEKHKKEDGWLNADLLTSKDGSKLYFKLNTYKPEPDKAKETAGYEALTGEDVKPEDVPF